MSFLNNTRLLFGTREKVLNDFRSRIFPTKNLDGFAIVETAPKPAHEPTVFATSKPTKEQTKKSLSKIRFLE